MSEDITMVHWIYTNVGSNHEVNASNVRSKLIGLNYCGGRLVLNLFLFAYRIVPDLNMNIDLSKYVKL